MKMKVFLFSLTFILILSAVSGIPATHAAKASLMLNAYPTLVNIGEIVQITGETEPKLDGALNFIAYRGDEASEVRGIPVEAGEISFEWIPSKPGNYTLIIIFVPENSIYETSVGIIKNITVKDVKLTLSVEKIFYAPGETVKASIVLVRKSDGAPLPYTKVSVSFAGDTVETITNLEGRVDVRFEIPHDAAGEYTVYASCLPAQATAKIYVDLLSRISQIRELDFKHPIPAVFITTEEYEKEIRNWMENIPEREWELSKQEYEALYILEEDADIKEISEAFWTGTVLGYYDSADNNIVIVTREEWPSLSEEVMVHELVHALTDQYFSEVYEYEFNRTDQAFALTALLEGDADTVKDIYLRKYSVYHYNYDLEGVKANPVQIPIGFEFIQYFPYIEGPNFVGELRVRGGWDLVNKAYTEIPRSTEQIIHPEKYGVDNPTKVKVEDRSTENWIILGRDTLGEFAIFIMFWNQGIIPFGMKDGCFTYTSNASEGWDGDEIVIYKRKGEAKYGYVWQIFWDSEEDAKEFLDAYEWMLWLMNATFIKEGEIWKIDSNDYVKIKQEGNLVTIVNAPSPDEIEEIHAFS